jgi:hypothetical protein
MGIHPRVARQGADMTAAQRLGRSSGALELEDSLRAAGARRLKRIAVVVSSFSWFLLALDAEQARFGDQHRQFQLLRLRLPRRRSTAFLLPCSSARVMSPLVSAARCITRPIE